MLARRLLNRGLLTVGSGLLVMVASTLVVCCLWLLSVRQGESDGFALAMVITGFIAAVTAVIPATGMTIFMIFKSYRFGDAPYHCLPTRMKDPFRGATAAAFALSVIPSALGISLPSTYATCASGRSRWHYDLPCHLLKAAWALCLVMILLTVIVLLPLRSAVRSSAIIPTKAASDTESTSSIEKPPIAAYAWLAAERPPTREQQRWMQRHNSLSSQKAIYPYAFDSMRPASNWSSGGYSPFPRPSSGWRANSLSDGQPTWSSSGSTVYMSGSRPSLVRPSAAGSRPATGLSFSSGSTYIRRYRLDHSADCPAIPESPHRLSFAHLGARPKSANDAPALPAPAWCPQLTHAPLSSDPAIRALTGSRSRLSQRLSRLPALTGISPVLSRQSTTSTSVLDPGTGRPKTGPSAAINTISTSQSRPTVTTSPTNVTPTFASVFGVDTKVSPQPAPMSSLPPLPAFSPTPSSDSPLGIPPRVRGHVLSPPAPLQSQIRSPSLAGSPLLHAVYSPRIDSGGASRSASRGGSEVRYLRRPSPLRLRTDSSKEVPQHRRESGIRKTTEPKSGISSNQHVLVRSQSRGRSHRAHARGSSAPKTSSVSPVKQQPADRQPTSTRYRGRSHTKKPAGATSASIAKSVSRGRRTRSTAVVSSSPPPVPRDGRATSAVVTPDGGGGGGGRAVRKSTAAAMTAAMVGMVRGRSVSARIHEQRGREKIQRDGQDGWYTPSCYSGEGGSGA